MGNKTVYPFGTGGQLPSGVGIINDLTTGGADKALSAEMGKRLAEQLGDCDITLLPELTLAQSYVNSSGEVKASGTAATTVSYYRVNGGDLTVDVGKTANSACRVLSLAETAGQTDGLVVADERMGNAAVLTAQLAGYDTRFKYLVVCHDNTAATTVAEHVPGLDSRLASLSRRVEHVFTEDLCLVRGKYIAWISGEEKSQSLWSSTDFIEVPQGCRGFTYCPRASSANSGLAFYDEHKQYISGVRNAAVALAATFPEGARYMRFCTMRQSGEDMPVTLTAAADGCSGFAAHVEAVSQGLDGIAQRLGRNWRAEYTEADCTIRGWFISTDGAQYTNDAFTCSDFIDTQGARTLELSSSWSASGTAALAFYDQHRRFVSAMRITQQEQVRYAVPQTAAYVRFTAKPGEANTVTLLADGLDGFGCALTAMERKMESMTLDSTPRHILLVGNSFTRHACEYLQRICQCLGVTEVNVQHLYTAGAGLQYYAAHMTDTQFFLTSSVDGGSAYGNGTLEQILAQPWDVVVFQQDSAHSADYNTYQPWLAILADAARRHCTRRDVRILFNMTWPWADDDGTMWDGIIAAAKRVLQDCGQVVDGVIASGTAVKNLRHATGMDLSYDGHHLSPGIGRYVAACALYAALVEPLSGVSVYGDTTDIDVSSVTGEEAQGAVSVDAVNRPLCHRAAMYGRANAWNVTDVNN